MVQHLKGEVDLSKAVWRRASGDTDSKEAVEVAFLGDGLIAVRKSSQPEGPILVFTQDEWDAFVAGAQGGEFDL